ncbi:hypothetical protein D3C73_1049410 [compost metagenome]
MIKHIDQTGGDGIRNGKRNRTDDRERQEASNQQRHRCNNQQLDGIMHPAVQEFLDAGQNIG